MDQPFLQYYHLNPTDFLNFVVQNPGVFDINTKLRNNFIQQVMTDIFFDLDKTTPSKQKNRRVFSLKALDAVLAHNPQFVFLSPGDNDNNLLHSTLTFSYEPYFKNEFIIGFMNKIADSAIQNQTEKTEIHISKSAELNSIFRNLYIHPILKKSLEAHLFSSGTLKSLVSINRKNKTTQVFIEKILLDQEIMSLQNQKTNTFKI